ncbi:MAG: hypothetical protein WD314_08315 [Trueperaceae bacterium]
MRIELPNSARLQNFEGFLRKYSPTEGDPDLVVKMHEKWIAVHPAALAMAACLGEQAKQRGIKTTGAVPPIRPVRYLMRMGLFDHLDLKPTLGITEHEEAGRFVPLTNIRTSKGLSEAIANLIPLLHAPPSVADPIKYVFSEMVRNVLEHSGSSVGAFVCAQYYKGSNTIAVGIADGGIGVLNSMQRSHAVTTPAEAIMRALRPGVSGATNRIGGNERNAGAGLFFTKSIAALSRRFFVIYSGDAAFKLLRTKEEVAAQLNADATADKHRLRSGLPHWQGTVVGIDMSVEEGVEFAELLARIREAYQIDVKKSKKEYFKQIRFS